MDEQDLKEKTALDEEQSTTEINKNKFIDFLCDLINRIEVLESKVGS